jgi:serine/threonine protein kinase
MAIQIWQPGDKIKNDRFEIVKRLGIGGFGITYLAEDKQKNQQVVIKTLNATQQSEIDFAQKQENFVKEGFTLRTFNHPHIVKVYEPIQIGDLWGLVMEYIPGQDLADCIIANGRLGEAEALKYIDQIAQALDYVHQQKFFHRDVKPANIMLRQDRREAVLIDFGIAKEFVDLETMYLSNSLGTELYKPIEQYEKRGQFGAYTDIYALAVTLYHLLTGAAPGGGSPLYTSQARKEAQDKGWGANLDQHLWGELAKFGISERTQVAIKAGMQIEPNQRPQNMTEFRQLLGLIQEPVAPPITQPQPFIPAPKPIAKSKPKAPVVTPPQPIQIDRNNTPQKLWLALIGSVTIGSLFWLASLSGTQTPEGTFLPSKPLPTPKIPIETAQKYSDSCNIKWENKQFKEALFDCNKAIELDPKLAIAYNRRGTIKYQTKQNKEALADYDKAIELDPKLAKAYNNRGVIKYEAGQKKEALADYDKAIELEPEYAADYYNRGNVKSDLWQKKEAIADYNKAIELEPKYAAAYYNRGNVKFDLGQKKEALADYNTGMGLNPVGYPADAMFRTRIGELEKLK